MAEQDADSRGRPVVLSVGSPAAGADRRRTSGVVRTVGNTSRRAAAPQVKLTAREQEVLRMIGDGRPNKAIARRLGISERTVKAHLTNVYQRLGVTDRTQAALWAQRQARQDGDD